MTKVRNKKRARTSVKGPSGPAISRPEPIRGSNGAESILKVAQKTATVFVSGLDPDTEAQTILDYLGGQGLGDRCICEKMKTVKQKKYSSFKLVVPLERKAEYMSASVWPKDVVVNHFQNLQRRQQTARTFRSQQN